MTTKKVHHGLQLIVALSRVDEKAVVASSFVIARLDCFLVTSQRRFEVARQRDVVVCASAAGGFSGAMQNEKRHAELSGTRVWSQGVARRMKNRGLNVTPCQEVLQDGSAAAGVPDEGEPIRADAWQRTRRLRQGIDELHCRR